jgi:Na+/H+-dicarboxylate symporter
MINSIIFKLLITLIFGFFFGNLLPNYIQSIIYAISLSLKEILIFFLPFIIFSCIISCLLSFKSDVFKFIIILLACICISGYISTFISYSVSKFALSRISEIYVAQQASSDALAPYWLFKFPILVSNNTALFSGFIAGLIFSKFKNNYVHNIANKMREVVTIFLNKVFVPVLPLFALGFVIKLESDGILSIILKSYFPLVVAIFATEIIYISILYFIASGFNFKKFVHFIKNAIPAGMMGFSTMSSMAALPLTIRAIEKNTGQVDLARTIAPATVNVHLIGDSIAIPMIALTIMTTFGLTSPNLPNFLIFASFFVLAKFAVAGIPGGGIVVMIPILEKHLGFSSEMSGLITAIYILLDPLNTTANVLGNGAFAILTTKLFKKKAKKDSVIN